MSCGAARNCGRGAAPPWRSRVCVRGCCRGRRRARLICSKGIGRGPLLYARPPSHGCRDAGGSPEFHGRSGNRPMSVRSTEEVKRILLDRVPSMLAYFDAQQVCRFANESYAAFVRRAAADALGRSLQTLLGSAEYQNRLPHVTEALRGLRQTFERRIEVDGRPRDLLVNYVPDEVGGKVEGFIVEITDVTSLRSAQEALNNSEARFRVLSESSPLGVYFADPTGKRTYVNSRWQDIYGLEASEGLGDGWMRAL